MQSPPDLEIGQRVHSVGDSRRMGTVKYVGEVEGYSGKWVGIEWDDKGQGKHDGSISGVRYFQAQSPCSASFVRPHKLSCGISLLQALQLRYRSTSTKQEEGFFILYIIILVYYSGCSVQFFFILGNFDSRKPFFFLYDIHYD